MTKISKIVRENKMHHLEKPIIRKRAQLKHQNPKTRAHHPHRAPIPEFCALPDHVPKVKVK